MTTASARPTYMPPCPPRACPPTIRIALIRPSKATVFRVFLVVISLVAAYSPRLRLGLCGRGGSSLLDLLRLHESQRASGRIDIRHNRVPRDELSAQELHRQRILNQP